MALWIEYRTCFDGVQLREVCDSGVGAAAAALFHMRKIN